MTSSTGTRKIVINDCYGGFSLSEKAIQLFCKYAEVDRESIRYHERELARDDPFIVCIVEGLEEQSWGEYAELRIVEIPADVEWQIDEYDGLEHVAEKHRVWRPKRSDA